MNDQHKPRPNRCRLILVINEARYTVRPIHSQDETVLKAYRLTRRVSKTPIVYDVAETIHGAICDCPDFIFRRRWVASWAGG